MEENLIIQERPDDSLIIFSSDVHCHWTTVYIQLSLNRKISQIFQHVWSMFWQSALTPLHCKLKIKMETRPHWLNCPIWWTLWLTQSQHAERQVCHNVQVMPPSRLNHSFGLCRGKVSQPPISIVPNHHASHKMVITWLCLQTAVTDSCSVFLCTFTVHIERNPFSRCKWLKYALNFSTKIVALE